jgi:hypothetical protein
MRPKYIILQTKGGDELLIENSFSFLRMPLVDG